MRVFFFGGTFDPPHLGHEKIVDFCLNNCEKLIIIPNKKSPNKIETTDAKHRVNMLNLLFNNTKITVDDFELNSNKTNYTYYTIQYLKKKYKDDLTMVIGYDQLINLENWFNYKKIIENINILCFNRSISNRFKENILYKTKNIKYVKEFDYDISSSNIKKQLIGQNKNNCNKILDHKVFEYIKINKLYES